MTSMKWGWFVGGGLAIALVGFMWAEMRTETAISATSALDDELRQPSSIQSDSAVRPSATATRSASRQTPVVQAASAPTPDAWYNKFARSSDYRVFVEEALKHPSSGGTSYAAYAVGVCAVTRTLLSPEVGAVPSEIPYVAPQDPMVHQARVTALRSAQAACSGFTDEELSNQRESELVAQARAEGDPIRKLLDSVPDARRDESLSARRALLVQILANGDPLLLKDSLERLLLTRTDAGLAYIDGSERIPAMQGEVFKHAVNLLPCRLGMPCDARTPELLVPCVNDGACFASTEEMVNATLDTEQKAQLAATLARLEESVRLRDATNLIR